MVPFILKKMESNRPKSELKKFRELAEHELASVAGGSECMTCYGDPDEPGGDRLEKDAGDCSDAPP